MTKTQKRRLWILLGITLAISAAVGLTLYALKQNISLFFTPSEVAAGLPPEGQLIRIGGLVAHNSVEQDTESLKVSFVVTDNNESVRVYYEGLLPDLFREGQGIVVQGRLNEKGELQAAQVLAKHDENYEPPEVVESLKKAQQKKESESL